MIIGAVDEDEGGEGLQLKIVPKMKIQNAYDQMSDQNY
jgi:hypothetical protein